MIVDRSKDAERYPAPAPPPPPPIVLPPDYLYGDWHCAVCLDWVYYSELWHRIIKGHRFRQRTDDERWHDAQAGRAAAKGEVARLQGHA